ncbi:MAG: hypothetical protein IK093_07285 [Ruminiclostridium sp.]|nr:hypothetical protein [Ruminiclostridium sp.]
MRTGKTIALTAAAFLAASALASPASADDTLRDGEAGVIFASSDWLSLYFVEGYTGDDAQVLSDASNVIVTGGGTYTVSVDAKTVFYDEEFGEYTVNDGADGFSFAAVEIVNGELLFPGSVITIDRVTLDGNEIALSGTPYASSPDGINTRVCLYNVWETEPPDGSRGVAKDASAVLFDGAAAGEWKNLTVTFTLRESANEPAADTADTGITASELKGSPDTGIEDVYTAAGIAILAAGAAAVFGKKRI